MSDEKALETTTTRTPAEMIQLAVERGADLKQLEGVLALQERWEANQAKKAYHQAMALFKSSAPKIIKDKRPKAGPVQYHYASLYNIVEKISAELSKHGLSASWNTNRNGDITVTCKITHKLGHSEQTSLSAPSDTSGAKNAIQAIGSTITYLERYTLLALTGLATHDQDDDGHKAVNVEVISDKQAHHILDLIAETGADTAKFLAYIGAESIEAIPKSKYQQAVTALRQKSKA